MSVKGWLCLISVAAIAWGQRPSEADAAAAIERARRQALGYAKSLPDFVCTEIIHRTSRNTVQGRPNIPDDKLTVKVSYSGDKDEHELVAVNDRPATIPFSSLSGTIVVGEFGGILRSIFDPGSQAAFHWEKWRSEGKRRLAVYSYVVTQGNSHYVLAIRVGKSVEEANVAFHGDVQIDSQTDEVVHYTYTAMDIPQKLGILAATTKVDYAMASVNGREYLLPSRSQNDTLSHDVDVENQMEFRDYRKFGSDSSVTFTPGK